MKKKSIILNIAALGVTITSLLAFRYTNNRHKLFISFITAFGGRKCVQCNAWSVAGVGIRTFGICTTSLGGNRVAIPKAFGSGGYHALYTRMTINGRCQGPIIRYTAIN